MTNRKIIMVCLCLLFLGKVYAQTSKQYEISKILVEDIISTLDSSFHFEQNEKSASTNYKGIRIIDKTRNLFPTSGLEYLKNKTPYTINDKIPFDLNSPRYTDVVVINVVETNSLLTISTFCFVRKNCNLLPIFLSKEYKIDHGLVSARKIKSLIVLDDYDGFDW